MARREELNRRRFDGDLSFALAVTFTVKQSQFERFVELVRANAAASLRVEPGCLRFDVLVPRNETPPTRVFLYEIYRDRAAFEAHVASAHFQEFDRASGPLVVSKSVDEYRGWENAKAP